MDTATATAATAIVTTITGLIGTWIANSAKQRAQEQREHERYAEFMREAFARELRAGDECERARMAQQAQHNAEIAEITERVHSMELQLQRASLEHAKCPIEIARLKQQVLQLMTRTPTTQEWDQAVAANPDIWAQIKGASR